MLSGARIGADRASSEPLATVVVPATVLPSGASSAPTGTNAAPGQAGAMVDVYVAMQAIPAGTWADDAISGGWVKRQPIPARYRPTMAIVTTDQIVRKVANYEIAVGSIIVDGMFNDILPSGSSGDPLVPYPTAAPVPP